MKKSDRIFVAGHQGLVGSAITRRLTHEGYQNLLLRSRAELDLTQQAAVEAFFAVERPQHVIVAAAKVGGILANNSYPGDFIRDNLLIATNVIDTARRHAVERLLFLSSSCVYPKHAPQPMKEEYLLTGALEPTNEPYAIAKIAGMKLCEAYRRQYGAQFISVLPTNLYGPHDNFDLETSHVLPALIRKFHEAQIRGDAAVTVWGSGEPRREFMHVDDMADACVFFLSHEEPPTVTNLGWGKDISIRELAELVRMIVGFRGNIVFDRSKPDGTPRKLLDTSLANAAGWTPRIELTDGITQTYQWYQQSRGVTAP